MEIKKKRTLSHLVPAPVDKFYFGAAYYPEHWDESYMERDVRCMKDAGFNVVRIAEFAWDIMEPVEGQFDFTFFDKVIDVLSKYDIDVFLSTPTAAPPRWLTEKHPEVNCIDSNGIQMEHGSRQHACYSSTIFRDYSQKITKAMAEHFKNNPGVAGWQTDNEFNCHFSVCYCPECQGEFVEFLKNKYSTIDELNKTWGNRFWALTYNNFEQIRLPKPNKPTFSNPTHVLEHSRFISHSVSVFQLDQVDILRETNSDWLIFHNGLFNNIEYRGDFSAMLDVLAYDVYPMFNNDSDDRARKHAFNLDQARSYSGNFIIPEHQSGPGGQRPYFHNTPEPGEVRMMSWRSIAHGADSLLYFRWRTCRFGAEEYWCGILDHDDVPRRRYDEISQMGHELAKVGSYITGSSVFVDAAVATGDFDVTIAHDSYHMGTPAPNWVAENIHQNLFQSGYSVGCIHPEDVLDGVKLYFIPHWELIKPEWLPALEKYVKDGGTLVIGARTGTRTVDNTITDKTFPGLFAELAGATVEEYGRLNENATRKYYLEINGQTIETDIWYESLKLTNAEPLAQWTSRHLNGQPAISKRSYGKGHVVYVGTFFTKEIVDALMPTLIDMSGLKKHYPELPEGIETVIRKKDGKELIILINGNDCEIKTETLPEGEVIIGTTDPTFEPYGVKIISK